MVTCAQCMYENADGAASCDQCGADLDIEALSMQLGQVCRSCDSYNDPGVRICVSCGRSLGGSDGEEGEDELEEVPAEELPEAPAPATPAQPWMAPPSPHATPLVAQRVEATPDPRSSAPLPPGALPPGWAVFQQKAPPATTRPVPARAVPCPRCQSENPPSARFCGSCGTTLEAAEAKARGKLILIRGIAGEARQFPLTLAATPVGTEGPIAFPEDPYVGRLHATLHFRGPELLVKDEGAGNGVFVKLREPQPLRPGDMFSVGERLLRWLGPSNAVGAAPGRHGSPRTTERLFGLEEVLEGGGVGRICRRAGPIVTIGRAGCDLNFPQDGFVSARHAEISIAGETAFLRDLGSANGTFLRVQQQTEKPLRHGDYLLMGRELLRVEVAAAR